MLTPNVGSDGDVILEGVRIAGRGYEAYEL